LFRIIKHSEFNFNIARPAILCLNETKIDDLALNKDGVKN